MRAASATSPALVTVSLLLLLLSPPPRRKVVLVVGWSQAEWKYLLLLSLLSSSTQLPSLNISQEVGVSLLYLPPPHTSPLPVTVWLHLSLTMEGNGQLNVVEPGPGAHSSTLLSPPPVISSPGILSSVSTAHNIHIHGDRVERDQDYKY